MTLSLAAPYLDSGAIDVLSDEVTCHDWVVLSCVDTVLSFVCTALTATQSAYFVPQIFVAQGLRMHGPRLRAP